MIGNDSAHSSNAIDEVVPARSVSSSPSKRPFTAVEGERRIRSFVLREGRQTASQQRAMTDDWPRYGIDYRGEHRDLDALFKRTAPRVLEIGFGNGDALLHAASSDPTRDYIGVEVHAPGVGRVLHSINAAGLSNLHVYRHDAVEVLENELTPGSLDEIRIWFPDPWHKKRHHKRRLVNPGFGALLASRLRVGGLLHLATDWEEYAGHMWDVLDAEPGLRNRFGARGACARPEWRLQTRFETRGLGLGHGVWDLLYDRIDHIA